jgi:NADP-dependent 3-hydroxy acid dehydrogenase YdfG
MTSSGDVGEFAGQVALVTGASSGIGRATALLLAERGATVVLVARNAERLAELEAAITQAGGRAFALPSDVTDPSARVAILDAVTQRAGRLDVLVNAAGVIASGRIDDTKLDAWRAMFELNVDAVFHLIQLAVPLLGAQRGAIVNVSSVCGLREGPSVIDVLLDR